MDISQWTSLLSGSTGHSSLQKTYDDCYLLCSTAVYFENQQNNEDNALRYWNNALEQIQYYKTVKATAATGTGRGRSETERALVESLRRLEQQARERVELLKTASGPGPARAPASPLLGQLLAPASSASGSNASRARQPLSPSSTEHAVRPLIYNSLPRQAALSSRPALPGHMLSSPPAAHSLSAAAGGTRAASPEKRASGMLRTLRVGRDGGGGGERASSRPGLGAGLSRSRPPAAARAATQAWGSQVNLSVPAAEFSLNAANGAQPSRRASAGGELTTAAFTGGAANAAGAADPGGVRRKMVPAPQAQKASSHVPAHEKDGGPYRVSNGAEPMRKAGALTAPALPRPASSSDTDRGRDKDKPSKLRRTVDSRPAQPQAASEEQYSSERTRPTTTTTTHTTADVSASTDHNSEEEDWRLRTASILEKLPKGVDEAAAKQIMNEVVVQGDEVHWHDVAGLEVAKSTLKETIVYPFLRPDLFLGLREPVRGLLLFGPPGTGKTMLARAVATESKSTFFSISASSLTSKFLGESEKLVRALFVLAKALAPSIIFVDEIDSLLSSRDGAGEHDATRRIKTEFLIQWSALARAAAGRDPSDRDAAARGDPNRVLVLAATNLPWAIDEAARRRFVRRQYIPLPEAHVRTAQIRMLLSQQKHSLTEAQFDALVDLTEGFSGSDITALAKDAAMGPLRSLGEKLLHMATDEIPPIRFSDFEASFYTIRPSVSKDGLKEYEKWAKEFGERGG